MMQSWVGPNRQDLSLAPPGAINSQAIQSPGVQQDLAALQAAFLQAREGGFQSAMPNLSPGVLSFLGALQSEPQQSGAGELKGYSSADKGVTLQQSADYAAQAAGGSPEARQSRLEQLGIDPQSVDWSKAGVQFGTDRDVTNYVANYSPTGEFQGYQNLPDGSSWKDFLSAMAFMAPAALGIYGAAGQAAGGGAAASEVGGAVGGASGGAGSITLPSTAEVAAGMAPATVEAAMPALSNTLAAGGIGDIAGGVAAGAGGSGLGTTGVNAMRAGEIANYATNGSLPISAATEGGNMGLWDTFKTALGGNGGWGETLAKLGMAAYGASEAKDQQQSVNREPWKPAQPLLMDLIGQTGQMSKQYQQNPFSQAQQGAYSNSFGLLDAINGMAPGLMTGMQANASGANNYDRTNPRRQLTGATAQMQWSPQSLLGMLNFGGGNGR